MSPLSYNSISEDINWGLLIIGLCTVLCTAFYFINKDSINDEKLKQQFMSDCVKAGRPPTECGAAWRSARWGN